MDFNQHWQNTAIAQKLEFLHSLLTKNEGLRNQFIDYCKPGGDACESPEEPETSEEIITESFENLKESLEALDLDDIDWEDYRPRHNGYIPEYEAIENIAEDQLDEIFEGLQDEILLLFNNGQSLNAACTILGAYDACLYADIPGSGNVFDDLVNTLIGYHKKIVNDAIAKIKATVISGDQTFQAAEVILDHYQRIYSNERDYLKYFEPLLMSFSETKETADRILQKLEISGVDEAWLPQLTIKLYSFHPDQTDWVKKASQYFMNDTEVAKQLLNYYFEHDVTAFLRDGKAIFALHPDSFAQFFHDKLYPDMDLDFFKKVLWHRASKERNIELYKALRGYLDDREKQLFIDSILVHVVFMVKILEMENRFADILSLAQKEAEHTWHFPELISPILNIFPNESFGLIKFKVNNTIAIEKGRDTYQRICTWLKLAVQIEGKEDDVRRLIFELYNRKPALPALKDEMRMAGVIII